jgi:hypothetical protein
VRALRVLDTLEELLQRKVPTMQSNVQVRNQDRRQNTYRSLWCLHRRGHDASCEIVVLPSGFEGRFLVDGRFLYSYTFNRPDDAIAWAKQKEAQCRRDGWTAGL